MILEIIGKKDIIIGILEIDYIIKNETTITGSCDGREFKIIIKEKKIVFNQRPIEFNNIKISQNGEELWKIPESSE